MKPVPFVLSQHKPGHASPPDAESPPQPAGDAIAAAANRSVKRVLDVVGSAVLLVFLAPALLMIALAVRLDSPGPALMRQRQEGLGGRAYTGYRFRTDFRTDFSARQTAIDRPGDVRPGDTRLGAVLRRSNLDGLPQLLNVLAGDMSLVGPMARDAIGRRSALANGRRDPSPLAMRPGMTGLAQVGGLTQLAGRSAVRGTSDPGGGGAMGRSEVLDDDYIQHWSHMLDLRILLKSVSTCLWRED